jgi:hypothetical protein
MRRILQVFVLSLCVWAAPPRHALAAFCGDGIVQAPELCDPGSPTGEVSCPGRCVSLPLADACHCANVSTDPRDFAAIADLQAKLAKTARIVGGGLAVVTTGGLANIGPDAVVDVNEQLIADRCRLLPGSAVGRVFCNDDLVLPTAFINGGGPFAFAPPLTFPSLPAFTTGTPAGSDVVVATGSTQYIAPGSYGNLIVSKGATLVLHGLDAGSGKGTFSVLGVKIIDGGRLFADNPALVNVKNALRLTGGAVLAPTPSTTLQPGDLHFNIEGRGAKLGKGASVDAHIRAPSGKISVGRGTLARGQLIAQKIVVQNDAILSAVGGCGDGSKEQSEMCDTTASGGDAACPGNCIPLGQAGQCTCRCSNDANCNDGNACNGVETCDAGHCVLGTPLNCDDGNACTIDCNPATGCVQIPKADGTGCDDGDECTKGDQCLGGACTPGEPRACNDGNDCTVDTCDPTKGCVHTAVGTGLPCSDGNACTQGDACIHGNCIGGTGVNCDDANPCTADTCTTDQGCQHTPLTDGISCAGTSPCSALDTCQTGVCVQRGAQVCSDGKECTDDSCTPVGQVGSQTPECSHVNSTNFTPCGPGGTKTCFNGVCL